MSASSAETQDKVRTLSEEQARLLRLLLERHSGHTEVIKPFPRDEQAGPLLLPTSRAQRRLWFIDQLEGGIAPYYISLPLRLRGELAHGSLCRALDMIVQRHEVLRTVFVNIDGEPCQEVRAQGQFSLRSIDLSSYPPQEREKQARLQALEEVGMRFNLSEGPLIRGRLLRLQSDEHVLLITMHHIVSDGWSTGILLRELAEFYRADAEGRANVLDPLSIQYGDYAHWQRQQPDSAFRDEQLAYWLARLRDAVPQLELPTDRPRPAVQSYRGAAIEIDVGSKLAGQLKALAQRGELTLFMVLYAAWAILLSRLSGQRDIIVGTGVANRFQPRLESMIGLFVNTLVLRVDVSGEVSVRDFLVRIKEVTLGAFAHQDVPFEHVVEKLRPERSLAYNPIFQTMLTLQSAPVGELALPGIRVGVEAEVTNSSMFDLLLSMREHVDGIACIVTYATDLFNPGTVLRWMHSFIVLLEGLVTGTAVRIHELPLFSIAEFNRVIHSFNATQTEYPRDERIESLFEEQASRTPHDVAAICEDQSLTYRELDIAANRLAHFLNEQGTIDGENIPVVMPRTLGMLVAQIAILKVGGVYVPIDPQIPAERQAFMIRDCGARRVLGEGSVAEPILAEGVLWHAYSDYVRQRERLQPTKPLLRARPVAPAYIMYTSGSTGTPKGVAISHRAVNRLVINNEYVALGPDDCLAYCSNPAFDASTFEVWGALLNGARVLVVPHSVALEVERFAELLRRHHVTCMFQTTALFNQRINTSPAVYAGLRYLLFGGEMADPNAVRRAVEGQWVESLINVYGPTETTTFATWYRVPPLDVWHTIPIGRPISNTSLYILDAYLKPVPLGVTGEIYIGGDGVALGYHNRPGLTADRFVADPFGRQPNARLYKSGDLGRWREDGNVEFLARGDRQLKVRGFRIEPGEIEARLIEDPRVRQAVVITREDSPGEKRLVAYLTRVGDADLNVEGLRARLGSVLPEYMVPSAFVLMAALPLTPNGKLDRRALPVPEKAAYATSEYEIPKGDMEQTVASLWEELLHVDRVGRRDNFFRLGGHSLLLVRLMERLRRIGLSTEVRTAFESPTLADFAHAVTRASGDANVPPNLIPRDCVSITPQMLPLVNLNAQHIEHIASRVGGARNIQDIYPLAPLQEGMLFHHLLGEQGGDVYLRTILLSLDSKGVVDDLIKAVQQVIDRHDALRTAVLWEQLPQPVQVVLRQVSLPVEEFSLDPTRNSIEQLQERMASVNQRLELQRAPMIRLQIAADPGAGRWYAVLVTHHLICDAKSLAIILSEIDSCLTGQIHALPQPLPYRNHVAQALAQVKTKDGEVFFRGKLAGIDETTAPFGLVDVRRDGSKTAEACHVLDSALATRIRFQARSLGVTAATLFHAAWALVIARTSARDDVVFGSVLLGRLVGSAGAQHIVGMFINTLPLRFRLRESSALELVWHAQRELIELVSYEQVALALAQRCSGIAGSAPLFTALLNYRYSTLDLESVFSDIPAVRILASQGGTNYPVLLSVDDQGSGFVLAMETDARIDPYRMLAYVSTALQSLVDALERSPDTPALRLSVLPEAERRQVLYSFNEPQLTFPEDRLLHTVFEEQVRRTPDALAVTCNAESLTYAELNGRADRLAAYLRRKGVEPDQLVGICVERGINMIVGLLGILKAGGAYVPLDPTYPAERLAFVVDDAAPRVILSEERVVSRLPESSAAIVILDRDWEHIAATQPGTDPDPNYPSISLRADHLAYVIYTSGSTGTPKGVMIEHRNVLRLFEATDASFHFDEHDVWTLFHSFAFDFSVWELWGGLLYGGRIVIVPYQTARSPEDFYALIGRERATVLNQTPSVFAQLIDAQLKTGVPHCLRFVIFGGEALEFRTLSPWVRVNGAKAPRLVNMYGITETTVHVTFLNLSEEDIALERGSLVGKAIPDLRVYVLDDHRQPTPIGVAGELYVSGAGVARGYWKRQELTAERFLKDPFDLANSGRMYKSGDLARWRADGTLEYLGRNDHQVKIRGFRIELGEIEAQLARHPSIKDVVVVATGSSSVEKRLVAYIVLAEPDLAQAPTVEAFREHAKAALPEHMIPNAFVLLQRLPLTANGKLDRRALPAPELDAYMSRDYVAPQGEVENELANIWKGLLGVARVGRSDNFFDLGGNSLLATRALSRIRERLEVEVTMRALFETSSLEQLARRVGQGQRVFDRRPPLVPRSGRGAIPVSFAQERLWFLEQTGLVGSAYNVPLAMRLSGPLNEHALERAFKELVGRHESLRTRFATVDGTPYQHIDPIGDIELCKESIEDVQTDAEREWRLRKLVVREQTQSFDLIRGPLLRAVLVRLRDNEHALLVTMHHIIVDGWSLAVLIRELGGLYGGYVNSHQHRLPPPVVHYADFAVWQRQWLDGEYLQSQLEYWREQLSGAPAYLQLPFDRQRPAVASFAGASLSFTLSNELCRALEDLAKSEGATLFMVFFAAYQWLLYRYSGQDDFLLGSPIAGRTHELTETMIGFFVNTLVLRADLSGNPSFRELLRRAREITLGAYAHQDMPFEKLVMELRPERNLAAQAMFQVMLALQNFPQERLELAGTCWERIPFEQVTAKFDLVLFLYKDIDAEPGTDGLRGTFEYATELFDEATIARMAWNFQQLLATAVADPGSSID